MPRRLNRALGFSADRAISEPALPYAIETCHWPFAPTELPDPAYLVGGAVRDGLLGRTSPRLDLDFVLPTGAVEAAKALARRHRAGFVLLDAQREIARVVFETATVDLARQCGEDLACDLRRRDFTVNAIAWDARRGQLIDPLGGYRDLQARLIRMVSPLNLKEDPLRLLRAYRQAAQLDFSIEPQTQLALRELAPALAAVAAERVRTEIGYLLRTPEGTPWLQAAWQDGLLRPWLPELGLLQFERLAAVDRQEMAVVGQWPELKTMLAAPLCDQRTMLMGVKLTALLQQAELDPEKLEICLIDLRYSRAEIRFVLLLLQLLPRFQRLSEELQLSRRQQYKLFQAAGSALPALALLAAAAGTSVDALAPWLERFLNPEDAVAHPSALVNGNELVAVLGIAPGPLVGRLLAELKLARAEGLLHTPEAALAFARQRLECFEPLREREARLGAEPRL